MKTSLFILAALSFSGAFTTSAQADGFVCQSSNGSLGIQAYNHTEPTEGTRRGALLVLSDNSKPEQKTLARFTSENGSLRSFGNAYDVTVRAISDEDKALTILGVPVATLNMISLDVDFSYGTPVKDGAALTGKLTLEKLDSSIVEEAMTCTRYLKNPK